MLGHSAELTLAKRSAPSGAQNDPEITNCGLRSQLGLRLIDRKGNSGVAGERGDLSLQVWQGQSDVAGLYCEADGRSGARHSDGRGGPAGLGYLGNQVSNVNDSASRNARCDRLRVGCRRGAVGDVEPDRRHRRGIRNDVSVLHHDDLVQSIL